MGNIQTLTPEEVDNFDAENTDVDGQFAYALKIGYHIPADVAWKTDDLPLGISRKTPKFEEMGMFTQDLLEKAGVAGRKRVPKLIASHESQTNYLISLNMLQLSNG